MAKRITLAELKKMIAKLNALKLGKENLLEAIGESKVKVSGKFDDLADAFMDAMEALADADKKAQNKVPKALEAFHNKLFDQVNPEEEEEEEYEDDEEEEYEDEDDDDEEEEYEDEDDDDEEEEEEEPTRRRRAAKKKKAVPKKKKKVAGKKKTTSKNTPRSKDEFGHFEGSPNFKFAAAISKKALTMKQVKTASWNEKEQTFYDCFNKMKERGEADKTEDGAMFVIGSAAEPKGGGRKKKTTARKKKRVRKK